MGSMNLSEVIAYQHKIKKIAVNNKNVRSAFTEVVAKFTIDSADNETVRFSLEKNDHFLVHQQIDNDYYCRIPNNLSDITYIYVHFLPSDLYDYTEDDVIFSIYNFAEIFEEHPTSSYYINSTTNEGEPYDIQVTRRRYEHSLDDEGRLIVRSTDSKSVTEYNDPNYKNYTTDDGLGNNMTQTGYYPLSSRYRLTQNWESPKIDNVHDSYWKTTIKDNNPYWEARINRVGLSPLITESAEDDMPINVFINYTYLPTSREYHQHYYGFEPANMDDDAKCKTINVLEGENLSQIDPDFASKIPSADNPNIEVEKKSNYRLINLGNVYDDSRSIYVPHGSSIQLSLDEFAHSDKNINRCLWYPDKCENYWIYTPIAESLPQGERGYCSREITLQDDTYYSLKYYIYIPSYAKIGDDECYIEVEAVEDQKIYKLHPSFIAQDRVLRNQWIYHEIPFKASTTNKIRIVGPQVYHKEKDLDNSIFFINIGLQEMGTYSPTLKYTNYGTYLIEGNQNTFKSANEAEICNNNKKENLVDTPWTPIPVDDLPEPYSDVFITGDSERYLYYDDVQNIRCIHPPYKENEKPILKHYTNDRNIYCVDYYKWTNTNKTKYQKVNKKSTITNLDDFINNTGPVSHKNIFYYNMQDNTYEYIVTATTNVECVAMITDDGGYEIVESIAANSVIKAQFTPKGVAIYENDIMKDGVDAVYGDRKVGIILPANNNSAKLTNIKVEKKEPVVEPDYTEVYTINNSEIPRESQSVLIAPNTHEDIQVSYDIETSDLIETHNAYLTGVRGQGNSFTFYFNDTIGKPISGGKARAAIFYTRDYYTAWGEAAGGYLEERPVENGKVTWSEIDLTDLPDNTPSSNKNKYYMRIEYKNDCRDQIKVEFKNLYIIEEVANISDVIINDATTIVSDKTFLQTKYNITTIEQLPLKISVKIINQVSIIKNGYCELSINDDLHQSTLVDKNGWADFYLNFSDLSHNCQTIKIEYYREYYKAIDFIYFNVCMDPSVNGNDAVLINVASLINGENVPISNNLVEVNKNDCALCTITTAKHSRFRFEVYRQKVGTSNVETVIKQNVYNILTQGFSFVSAEHGDENDYIFTIKTGNILDQNNKPVYDLYRDYQRSFTIHKK